MARKPEIKQFQTTDIDLESVQYSPYNPRRISAKVLETLKRSLTEFGLVDPIVVNQRNMNVVGGNQRLRAMRELGIDKAKAVIIDVDDDQEKALNIALNKIGGEWDFELLKNVLADIPNEDQALTGFDKEDLEIILGAMTEGLNEDFGPPAPGNGPAGDDNAADGESSGEDDGEREVAPPAVRFVLCLQFQDKEFAEQWMAENQLEGEFTEGKRTIVVRMAE